MNEIIKITENKDRLTVSGRDLHRALGVRTAYKDWFPRMCEYGFTEGVDFNPLKFEQVQKEGARYVSREITDHQLTIAMAKEVSMLQRTEKGKEVRQYFIHIEEQWNRPEMVMARGLQAANALLAEKNEIITKQTAVIAEMQPKALFADAVSASQTSILVGEMAKILKQNGIDMGQNRFFDWLRSNGYLMQSGSSKNLPTQRSMEMGLFEIRESTQVLSDGSVRINKTPKILPKGQIYFVNKFLGKNNGICR